MTKKSEAQTPANRIIANFTDRQGRKWMREAGRTEITVPHYPLGWLPLDEAWSAALDAAITAGEVHLVELPRRAGSGTVTFVVKGSASK
jgi:hypothetical protein